MYIINLSFIETNPGNYGSLCSGGSSPLDYKLFKFDICKLVVNLNNSFNDLANFFATCIMNMVLWSITDKNFVLLKNYGYNNL